MTLRRLSGVLAASLAAGLVAASPAATTVTLGGPPTTGFEDRAGASWTTHEEELEFLAAVDAATDRVAIDVIGESDDELPLHLVRLGAPAPATAEKAREKPTTLFVCSQHGNEPAGREACLITIRDLAFTDDPALLRQLEQQTILYVPTANPSGRVRNVRTNASNVDINRDHLGLRTPEARAMAAVIRDYEPDVAADLHEYGPSLPAIYDDELLYLWSRNLNVHEGVRTLARSLAEDYIKAHAIEDGDTADEYGQYKLFDYHLSQSAGDHDEGIARNAIGLRHVASILLETAVTQDVRNGVGEVVTDGELESRRVAHHVRAVYDTLRYMRDLGVGVAATMDDAAAVKAREGSERSAPVYFGGADNQEPTEDDLLDAPCGYLLDATSAAQLGEVLDLHGITGTTGADGSVFVGMGQRAEPAIPLLLDERARDDRGYPGSATRVTAC